MQEVKRLHDDNLKLRGDLQVVFNENGKLRDEIKSLQTKLNELLELQSNSSIHLTKTD